MMHTDITFVNKTLINHTLKKSSDIDSANDCLQLCLEDVKCWSINFQPNIGVSQGSCEINNATAVDYPMDFIDKHGYIYYEAR